MENTILEVNGLRMHYLLKKRVVKAVDGVSFSINEGETFGLVGESGCGKSATCRSIIGLIHKPGKIVDGSIKYKGTELVGLGTKELGKIRGSEIGMIFQEPMTALNPVLKIKDQLMESFKDRSLTKAQKHEKAIQLLKLVGIPSPEQRMEAYPHQFSGGMRQRAMIAIALASQPRLLLADEPTTALDVTIQDQIIKLLKRLKQELKMSLILVTHDLGVAAQMCDRMAVMYAGHIMEITDAVSLFESPRHPYTLGLMASVTLEKGKDGKLMSINGTPPDLANMPKGCPFAPRCRYCEQVCTETLPELKEIAPGHWSRCHCVGKLGNAKGIIASETKGGEA